MTLRRIFNWIIGLPIAIVAVVFAVANRQWILVSFDPFSRDQPWAAITMPLWVLFFCGIFVGLMAGWIFAWLAQGCVEFGLYIPALAWTAFTLAGTLAGLPNMEADNRSERIWKAGKQEPSH